MPEAGESKTGKRPSLLTYTIFVGVTFIVSAVGGLLIWGANARPTADFPEHRSDYASPYRTHAESIFKDPDAAREVWTRSVDPILDRLESLRLAFQSDGRWQVHAGYITNEPDTSIEEVEEFRIGREVTTQFISQLFTPEIRAHAAELAAAREAIPPWSEAQAPWIDNVPHWRIVPGNINSNLTDLAGLYLAQVHLALNADELDEAIPLLRYALAIARHLETSPYSEWALSASRIRGDVGDAIFRLLKSRPMDPARLASIKAILEEQRRSTELTHQVALLRLEMMNAIQETYSPHGIALGATDPNSDPIVTVRWVDTAIKNIGGLFLLPSRRATTQDSDEWWFVQSRIAEGQAPPPEFQRQHQSLLFRDRAPRGIGWPNRKDEPDRIRFNAAKIAAAIELFKSDQSHPPPSLQHLVPTYLPSLPRALILDSDGEFNYRVSSMAPLGYVLYLDGPDNVDDDGFSSVGLDFWQTHTSPPGTDLIFTVTE